jgi:hypothetical protein
MVIFKNKTLLNVKKIHQTDKAFDDFKDLFKKFKTYQNAHKVFDFCSVALSYDVWNMDTKSRVEIRPYALEVVGIVLWLYEFKDSIIELEKIDFWLFPSIQCYKDSIDLLNIIADSRNNTLKFK